MSFKKIVVIGGGPIGLFCAIEAAQTFNSFFSKVTMVEMRKGYSRMNVPVLPGPVLNHLTHLNIKTAAVGEKGNAPLAQVEQALFAKAKSAGVRIRDGHVAVEIAGLKKRKDGRFKDMAITIAKWDPVKKTTTTSRELLNADLLILAVGASGIENDLFKKKLGFDHTTLGASNFAMYGVYNKNTGEASLGRALHDKVKMLGDATRVQTDNSEYLLVTLKQATPSDFALLQTNSQKLRECMDITGKAYANQVMSELNDNAKAVGAFEIKIKRVGHSISPKFPAVLVGDAAVSPHPQTGSGLLTGFHGFEALQDLLTALKLTNRSSDEAVDSLCAFEDSYEVYIAAKAIEGTVVILRHLIGLLTSYEESCGQDFAAAKGSAAKYLISFNALGAGLLRQKMEAQMNRALRFGELLHSDVVRLDNKANSKPRKMHQLSGTIDAAIAKTPVTGTLDPSDSIKRLWSDIAGTYQEVVDLTANYHPLQKALDSMKSSMPRRV